MSSSKDKTVWSMATWACLQTVRAYPAGSEQYIESLAVSGPTLVGGSWNFEDEEYEERVWDLKTLEPLRTLTQPVGQGVLGLASDGGEVWGLVGEGLVVWGRRG